MLNVDHDILFQKPCALFSVPPETPVIVMNDATGILAANQVGPYNEGSSLRLTCEVVGGKFTYIIIFLV